MQKSNQKIKTTDIGLSVLAFLFVKNIEKAMIWVFKTTVKNRMQVRKVAPLLNELLLPYAKWNFDLNDCDKILRIESLHKTIDEKTIIQVIQNSGQAIEVMPD